MDANKCPFQVLLDPQQEFYRELGLRRSVARTAKLELLNKYAKSVAANIPFSPSATQAGDDIYLMAGDFIADSSGKLEYVYNAEHAHDRPSVSDMLSSLA